MFREYEAATTSQSLASAQLKHALAQKQLIESKLLHIKNRLHQLQFDAGKWKNDWSQVHLLGDQLCWKLMGMEGVLND